MRRVLVALAVLMLAGCAGSPAPSVRVALIPSVWEIVSVSGEPIHAAVPPTLSIGRSNSAWADLPCGEVDLEYMSDTAGSALRFREQRALGACTSSSSPDERAIRSAFTGVRTWRAVSSSAIELLDDDGGVLLSLNATTCDCPHQPPAGARPTSS